MKSLSLLATGVLAALIMVAPAAVTAATITASVSPTTTLTTGSSYTVSGTLTPAQSGVSALISVFNPSNVLVDTAGSATSSTTGAYTQSFVAGGSANWITGTYTVTVSAAGASASTSFSFSGPPTLSGGAALSVQVTTAGVVPGQDVRVYALVQWSNGSLTAVSSFPISHYHTGTGLTQLGPFTTVHPGLYFWTVSTSSLSDGVYAVHIEASAGGAIAQGLGAFTVQSLATAASQKSIMDSLTNAATSLASLSSTLSTVNSGIANIQTSLSGMTSTLTSVGAAATAASQAVSSVSSKVDSTLSAVNSSQTYVLVVAALAAITLVLELAILVRKLS